MKLTRLLSRNLSHPLITLLSISSSSTSPLRIGNGDPPGLSTSRLLITGVHCCDNLPSLMTSLRLPSTGVACAEPKIFRAKNGLSHIFFLVLVHSWRHNASKFANSTETLVCIPLGCVVRMVCFAMLQWWWSSSRHSIFS